jgi:hypothetical protein
MYTDFVDCPKCDSGISLEVNIICSECKRTKIVELFNNKNINTEKTELKLLVPDFVNKIEEIDNDQMKIVYIFKCGTKIYYINNNDQTQKSITEKKIFIEIPRHKIIKREIIEHRKIPCFAPVISPMYTINLPHFSSTHLNPPHPMPHAISGSYIFDILPDHTSISTEILTEPNKLTQKDLDKSIINDSKY